MAKNSTDQDTPIKQLDEGRGTPTTSGVGADQRVDDQVRASRATDERAQSENRVYTEAERLDMFRMTLAREVLPDLPPIPGYHVCWLTTTNPRDSIAGRIRLGYELIKVDELGGTWLNLSPKAGSDFAGCIMVEEMIAAKLPLSLFEAFMLEAHHHAPNREQEKLTTALDVIKGQAETLRAKVIEEEGTAELRQRAPAPRFV